MCLFIKSSRLAKNLSDTPKLFFNSDVKSYLLRYYKNTIIAVFFNFELFYVLTNKNSQLHVKTNMVSLI